jgi:hypothetical protein
MAARAGRGSSYCKAVKRTSIDGCSSGAKYASTTRLLLSRRAGAEPVRRGQRLGPPDCDRDLGRHIRRVVRGSRLWRGDEIRCAQALSQSELQLTRCPATATMFGGAQCRKHAECIRCSGHHPTAYHCAGAVLTSIPVGSSNRGLSAACYQPWKTITS